MTRFGGMQFGQFRDLSDYMAAEEAFQAQKRKAELDEQMRLEDIGIKRKLAEAKLSGQVSDGNLPATIQIANEMQKAKAAGDVERFNLLNQVHKTMDRGVYVDPSTGQAQLMPGYGQTMGELSGYKAGGARQAQKTVDLGMEPRIQSAKEESKRISETKKELVEREASIPRLIRVVENLGKLSKKATYSIPGQAVDWVAAQSGYGATEGAKARTEYQSIIDNEILPLLRQTFGAQFTQKEGESLRATLGDVNKTPAEKQAVLSSFIDSKIGQIETLKRQIPDGVDQYIPPLDEQENASIGIKIDAPPPQVRPLSKYEQGEADFNRRKSGNMKNKSDEELMKILMGK